MITKNIDIKKLAMWIAGLQVSAENDERFDVAWFPETSKEQFSIVGGWMESGFTAADRDIFCLSEQNPKYVMAIKVVINDGPYAYCDFETLSMPMDANNPDEVDDTLFVLEWDTDPEALAEFFYGEWERIMANWREV